MPTCNGTICQAEKGTLQTIILKGNRILIEEVYLNCTKCEYL
jgi:hypothetical protein